MGDPQLMFMFYGCSIGILRLSLFLKKMELVPCLSALEVTQRIGLQAGLQGLVDAQHVERMRANTSSGRKILKVMGQSNSSKRIEPLSPCGQILKANLRKEFIHVCPSLPLGLPHDSLQHPHWIDSETSQQTFGVYYPGILNLPEDVHVPYINQDWWSFQIRCGKSGNQTWLHLDNSPFSSMMLPGTWHGVPMLQQSPPQATCQTIKPFNHPRQWYCQ